MKSLILSSAGLKNVVSYDSQKFHFIFGEKEILMDNLMAEFISPKVSRLHQADRTINSINFSDSFDGLMSIFPKSHGDIFSSEIISLLQNISKGILVEISKEQSFNLQLISILLGNEELFTALNEKYSFDLDETNINLYLEDLDFFQKYIGKSQFFEFPKIIDFIASHFYQIDQSKLLKYPKSIIYSIISNSNLKIENEDSLLDFINQIFENENENGDDDISVMQFYEEIQFTSLSKPKFKEFLLKINANEIDNIFWTTLCECLSIDHKVVLQKYCQKRYFKNIFTKEFNFDVGNTNRFQGIIYHLTEECGGNVCDKSIVNVTSSSTYSSFLPKNVVSFDNNDYFFSNGLAFDWLMFDFKEKKVRPTYYSIRSRYGYGAGGCHLREWVIEGSNDSLGNNWKILDLRKDVNSLNSDNAADTFNIQTPLEKDEYFRFLRIRITGLNTANCKNLSFSALEFFGSIL